MPIITVQLKPGNTGANVRELHSQLSAFGALIAAEEKTARRFGNTTLAAVTSFRKRFGLPQANGNAPFDASVGRLLPVAVAFNHGDRLALRASVREAVAAATNASPQENNTLARFAVIAGDYPTAQQAAARAPQLSGVVMEITNPVLDLRLEPPRPPEIPFPENFYTFHNELLPLALIEQLQDQLRSITPAQAGGPADNGPDSGRGEVLIDVARNWLEAMRQWELGNRASELRRYDAAATAYTACQRAGLSYFTDYHAIDPGTGTFEQRLSTLIIHLARHKDEFPELWEKLERRRTLITLEELHAHDWNRSPLFPTKALGLFKNFLRRAELPPASLLANRQEVLDAPLIILMYVLVPLARAEANRLRRQYGRSIRDLNRVITPFEVGTSPLDPRPVSLACDFIELPFARLLLAEALLDTADAEYKARIRVANADVGALQLAGEEFKQRLSDPGGRNQTAPFQLLKAAKSYLSLISVFASEGKYVPRIQRGMEILTTELSERLSHGDVTSNSFRAIGKDITIPTVRPVIGTHPAVQQSIGPHGPLLRYEPPGGPDKVMREVNPRVYAILLAAQARLVQLWSGFNYLGYSDEYVPPQRFQFLLDRARYFAEHAKNAERDYLNFLANAEREEFQELSTAQNVKMEKMNVHVETARVDQVRDEVVAAQQSNVLAKLSAADSQLRFDRYSEFDANMQELEADSFFGSLISNISSLAKIAVAGVVGGPAAAGVLAANFVKDSFNQDPANSKAQEQRNLEKFNLALNVVEAAQAANVAAAQLDVAKGGLIVAGLQRQAALLRHEFAIQNLTFIRNRVLNAEQWYRLAASIRSVGETYLRYAVELSFLAEQAYEFEADKRINVIQFDYDSSEVGAVLAGDFLLRDLDTLEQDLIVGQRIRQQQVRYVLSMAREFPEALQEIRDNGKTTFSLRLEQIEKRFPGLYNLRIGAVDVLPVALMDSTRFSMELTHLGTSQVRLKAQPDTPTRTPGTSPLTTNDLPVPADGWLAALQETFPIKLRVTGPETVVFSGLSRQDVSSVFAFATASQRQAFESLGAAAAWQVDFTARDNQVVPGSLADLLITFTLSGYHDPELRTAVDTAPRVTTAATRFLSGQTTFPDALYEFNRSGRMTWNVSRDLLTLTDTLGAVRNFALLILPASRKTNYFCNVISQYEVQIRITSAGELKVLSEIPKLTFTPGDAANPLLLTAQATVNTGAEISWDFGDGTARQSGADQQHTYAKPGRYLVGLRVVRDGRLSEFQADVVVSRSHADGLKPPVTAFPGLTRDLTSTDIPVGQIRVVGETNAAIGDPVVANWRADNRGGFKGNHATFDLQPGDHTLFFSAVRPLKAHAYSNQRHLSAPVFDFSGLSLASNRRFDQNGTEITGVAPNPQANLLAQHLFGNGAISPIDEWTIELPLADNPFLRSVSATDVEQYDLAQIQDVVLALEYETTATS